MITTSSMAASRRKNRKYAIVLFIIYMFLLCYFLFVSERLGKAADAEYRYNIVLFQEIKRFANNIELLGVKAVIINLAGNVIAFMPFGFLLPAVIKQKIGVIMTTFLSFEFSLFVECLQLYMRVGCFDVDDLLLNTIGGFLGYLVYYLFVGRRHGKK